MLVIVLAGLALARPGLPVAPGLDWPARFGQRGASFLLGLECHVPALSPAALALLPQGSVGAGGKTHRSRSDRGAPMGGAARFPAHEPGRQCAGAGDG